MNKIEWDKFFVISSLLFYNIQFSKIYVDAFKVILLASYIFAVMHILLRGSLKQKIISFVIPAILLVLFKGDTRILTISFFGVIIDSEEKLKSYLKLITIENICCFILIFLLGFNHKNGLGLQLGTCIIQYLLFIDNNFNIKKFIAYLFFVVVSFILIDSSQYLICSSLFLLLLLLHNYEFFKNKIDNILTKNVFLLSALFNIFASLALNINYYNYWLPKTVSNFIFNCFSFLDKCMSYRLSLSYLSLNLFSFKLYGNVINSNSPSLQHTYFNIDSGYIQLLQGKGFILFILVLAILFLVTSYLANKKYSKLLIAAIVIALWIINEEIIFSIRINFLWMYVGIALRYFYKKIKMKRGLNNEQ